MGKLIIEGVQKIEGVVNISGAKNSALPIIAGTILTGREYILYNVPNIEDVKIMLDIIRELGCIVKYEDSVCYINTKNMNSYSISKELAQKLRSSIIFLGPMLSRIKEVKIPYPGGCNIGSRPIDLHISSFKELGAYIEEEDGCLVCNGKDVHSGTVIFNYPSVGATENIIMLAVNQPGVTRIINPAIEPEIIDLIGFLNICGYCVELVSAKEILIVGNSKLNSNNNFIEYTIIPDRIEAGTYIAMTAVVNSNLCLKNANKYHLQSVINTYKKAGCMIDSVENEIYIINKKRIKSIDRIITKPYPGFPTDMQAQLMASFSVAQGISLIEERIFENRYRHVEDLLRMGAKIAISDGVAIVNGVDKLHGEFVKARDLRGGASLVIAAICAEGKTVIDGIEHIYRGYEDINVKLNNIGVDARI